MTSHATLDPGSVRLDPRTPPVELLKIVGPSQEREDTSGKVPGAPISSEAAIAYCRGLAVAHYENFSVLTSLVPERLRDDFAAVYAFCRWSDDLADETGAGEESRARSLALLAWWRGELDRCFDDSPAEPDAHPVFIALRQTRQRHPLLLAKPFHDLIDAFVQDQHVRAYRTWDQCVDYCTRSANPVGRIVLALAGYADNQENAERYRMSDATCTALQLINFWQDVRRDLLERDRVYLPSETTGVTREMLVRWAEMASDPKARVPFIRAMTPLVDRTAELFEQGHDLPRVLRSDIAPVVWLFGAGGEAILSAVRRVGCATLWERPHLTKATKAALVGRAWLRSRVGTFAPGK